VAGRPYGAVEELTASHNVGTFDCGSDAQTEWLREHALQSHRGGMGRVVIVRRLIDDVVVGFYALTTGSVLHADAPRRLTQGSGAYDIPVILLTRLGVDLSEQGAGLGRALVKNAFQRVERISREVGVKALLIHAENDEALGFYDRIANFDPSPSDPMHLLLLMKDLRKAMQ
jgi:GNAT superfamily N-acetyltransferase